MIRFQYFIAKNIFFAKSIYRLALTLSVLCIVVTPAVQATGTQALSGNINHLTYEALKPNRAQVRTSISILDQLSYGHYQHLKIDDALSSVMFDHYLKDLDSMKSYFLKSDIDEFEQYRNKFDDFLKSGNLKPGFEIFNQFQVRAIERLTYVINQLENHYDAFKFDSNETLVIDEKDSEWAKTSAQLNDLWRRRILNIVLNLRLTNKEPEKIQALLVKRYRSRLNRLLQNNDEDAFQTYINAFAQSFDPHTQYFSPRTSENFNINMSLSLEGIGAVLQTEEEYTEVVRLVPAGPAEKSKQLHPSDRVIGVGQGADGEMVDVIGWRIDEVVDLIRGPKDTIVRLDVIPHDAPSDQKTKIVSIIRDKVKLEEQAAKKHILEVTRDNKTSKIGILSLPTFYIDFQALQNRDPSYKSSTRDAQKLIDELKVEGIDGLIVDLRDNGGGSLQEASSLLGLFIRTGPTVQIKDDKGRIEILRDSDSQIHYSGPLVVLVNRLSASASEIFAGAIQDYQRGIVVGAQTFGKGTVQALKTLSQGQLKITQAKFYRISGESNQHLGIVPDIEFPSLISKEDIGESALDHALGWDKITSVQYQGFTELKSLMPELKKRHVVRTKLDPDFDYLDAYIDFIHKINKEKVVSLNEKVRKEERIKREKEKLALENKKRKALHEPLLIKLEEVDDEDSDRLKSAELPSEEQFKKDSLIKESAQIILDYVVLLEKHLASE